MSSDICVFHIWGILRASRGQRPGTMLNILQCIRQLPTKKELRQGRSKWELFVLSDQFCCELKTALKNQVFFFKKRELSSPICQ